MSKKLRLDFWKKSFWKEPHALTAVKDATLDVLLPHHLGKVTGLVTDLLDDGKINGTKEAKTYSRVRTVTSAILYGALIYLFASGKLTPEQFMKLIQEVTF